MPPLRLFLLLLLGLTTITCHPAAHEEPTPRPTLPPPTLPDTFSASVPEPAGDPADVIRRYYAALEARDYPRAYALWGAEGPPGNPSLEAFAEGFRDTEATAVEVGEPRVEGAAGSLYATVPVTVRARTTSGTAQRFTGTYTLRRINDVPGSTAEQRRWHLASAELQPVR